MTSGPKYFTEPLTPAVRSERESYLTFEELLAISDRPQADVRVPFWRNALVRVQALGLEQQEAITRAARIKAAQLAKDDGDSATQDWATYVLESIRHGLLMPRLDEGQIYLLRNRNPKAMEMLCQFIWNLSYLNQDYIDGLVTDLTTTAGAAAAAAPVDLDAGR